MVLRLRLMVQGRLVLVRVEGFVLLRVEGALLLQRVEGQLERCRRLVVGEGELDSLVVSQVGRVDSRGILQISQGLAIGQLDSFTSAFSPLTTLGSAFGDSPLPYSLVSVPSHLYPPPFASTPCSHFVTLVCLHFLSPFRPNS